MAQPTGNHSRMLSPAFSVTVYFACGKIFVDLPSAFGDVFNQTIAFSDDWMANFAALLKHNNSLVQL